MNERKTPDWLVETQNKSWEPEILISGITLTFLFFLPEHIYNFYGMLIQEYGLRHVVGNSLYNISIVVLTGLKMILILHLVLRGVWTGFVGLSYVFPEGVKKDKMLRPKKDIDYRNPEEFVIRLERICSLLFSFIFSSLIFVIGFFILFVPITLLYVTGLDPSDVRLVILFVILPLVAAFVIIIIVMGAKKHTWKIEERIENSIFTSILNTYCSNIGPGKTLLIFALYFALIGFLSMPYYSSFDFDNDHGSEVSYRSGILELDKNNYRNMRDSGLRISRAAIGRLRVEGRTIELFAAFFKEDLFTVKNLRRDPDVLKKLRPGSAAEGIGLEDIIGVYIDGEAVRGLRWYSVEKSRTGQSGITALIPLDGISPGHHELRIDKVLWADRRKEARVIKDWEVIPFERVAAPVKGMEAGEKANIDFVLRYFERFFSGKARHSDVRELLTDDFVFRGPLMSADSADEYVDMLRALGDDVEMYAKVRKISAEGNSVAALVDFEGPSGIVAYSQWFTMRGGKIARLEVVYDPRPFLEMD